LEATLEAMEGENRLLLNDNGVLRSQLDGRAGDGAATMAQLQEEISTLLQSRWDSEMLVRSS
jgi:hypothetical protein